MDSKYYVPNIEEFHVGFEYEQLTTKPEYDPDWKFKVKKAVFTVQHVTKSYFKYNFPLDLAEGKILVKYLDREDIESFDFEFTKTAVDTFYVKRINSFRYTVAREGGDIYSIRKGGDVIFMGIIKNKSEFKKLLKQLEI